MKKSLYVLSIVLLCLVLYNCTSKTETKASNVDSGMEQQVFGGFTSQVEWGNHLVTICGCNDCHSPKKMTATGPVIDSSILLSGHPEKMPAPDIDRKMAEEKGFAVTQTLTAWVGPWGISYAANLTSDPTGIGSWKDEDFMNAMRKGWFMGMENTRPIMPPMPWEMYRHMSDDELKAIFAYLKSTKPIENVVPNYQPPVSAM